MTIRYRDDDSPAGSFVAVTLGALAGFAVGVIVAQRFGGVKGIADRLRGSFGHEREMPYDRFATVSTGAGDADEIHAEADAELADMYEEDELDTAYDEELDATLEENVLEAFQNDPVLCECAIDIGALGDGVIELAGTVDTEEQAEHAVTIARGVPEVETVVNRLVVAMDERKFADAARRVAEGDPALTEARWEGQQVGTGKRRQGNSDEADRHADPKPGLEDRWLSTEEAMSNSADDTPDAGNRPGAQRDAQDKSGGRGSRRSGAPKAPTGVPKGDHVVGGNETRL